MMEQKIIRCAVYTRKSCEDGLEQEFNSLDAQRLAGANYIASQIHENWRLISKHYDDGGYSGGNLNRPALKELFTDIEAGLVDMVVVYKIDRLSRSLFDFSKIVELFEKHNVSFVSVTQSFNTSTSSGKLMLNILLSFAQFEREMTGERIRDKFASSLKKGLWMGGNPPMGYDVKDRKLVINEEYAKLIRLIFEKFIKTESYFEIAHALNNAGIKTKRGSLFSPQRIQRILKNPYYKGCVTHKGNVYPGEHEAIIDEETWDKVQEIFKSKSIPGRRQKQSRIPSFLSGLIKCSACGCRMKQTLSHKKNLRYRYYTCYNHIKFKSCSAPRSSFPAEPIEQQVVSEIVRILKSPEVIMHLNRLAEEDKKINKTQLLSALKNLNSVWHYLYQAEQKKIVDMLVNNVIIREDGLKINLNLDGFDPLLIQLAN
ncbi:MAG: recombinase family protein [Alphaproteobacteria bacterium]|nr:recombinase family protein [Alphaproteobacteria bacterium]